MTKQTKMYLAIGAIALVGYYIWKQSQKPKGDTTKKAAGSRTASSGCNANCIKRETKGTEYCHSGYIYDGTDCNCGGCVPQANVPKSFKGSNIAMRNRNK
jgi:hypothetical protein